MMRKTKGKIHAESFERVDKVLVHGEFTDDKYKEKCTRRVRSTKNTRKLHADSLVYIDIDFRTRRI